MLGPGQFYLKGRFTASYKTCKWPASLLQRHGKGTKCVKNGCFRPQKHAKTLLSMFFPVFCAPDSVSEIQYADLIWKQFFGRMTHPVADLGCKKG